MKVIRLNLDVCNFDDFVTIKENATKEYFRELEQRAKNENLFVDCGIDRLNRCYFVINFYGTRYRYSLVED